MDITVPASGSTTQVESTPIPPGIITHALATMTVGAGLNPTTNGLACQLLITRSDKSITHPIYVLTTGILNQWTPVYWHGLLSLPSHSFFTIILSGDMRAQTIYANLNRLTNTNIQALGTYLKTIAGQQ